MSFGANLKRERKLRGITLQEIAQETKIPLQNLRYIETDQFNRLPKGIFRESFIRSYSRYLGINEEKTAHEFLFVTKHNPSSEISEAPINPSKTFSVPFPKKDYPTKNSFFSSLRTGRIQITTKLSIPYILPLIKLKNFLKTQIKILCMKNNLCNLYQG